MFGPEKIDTNSIVPAVADKSDSNKDEIKSQTCNRKKKMQKGEKKLREEKKEPYVKKVVRLLVFVMWFAALREIFRATFDDPAVSQAQYERLG